jgi:hypothetical protein
MMFDDAGQLTTSTEVSRGVTLAYKYGNLGRNRTTRHVGRRPSAGEVDLRHAGQGSAYRGEDGAG